MSRAQVQPDLPFRVGSLILFDSKPVYGKSASEMTDRGLVTGIKYGVGIKVEVFWAREGQFTDDLGTINYWLTDGMLKVEVF